MSSKRRVFPPLELKVDPSWSFEFPDELTPDYRSPEILEIPAVEAAEYLASTVTEHGEQVALMEWVALQEGRYPVLKWLHAIPNGGLRGFKVAQALKAEGVKPGVSDLCLPFPAGTYHGMYLEMKKPGGKLSKEQKEFLEFVKDAGFYTGVAYGYDEAVQHIEYYMGLIYQ